MTLKLAIIGSVSQATLREEDLIPSFTTELEYQIGRNGAFLALPENFPLRDRLASVIGEAQDAFNEDATELREDADAGDIINSLCDALDTFSPPYCSFGAHLGDGADFGFWPSMDAIEELPHGTSEDSEQGEDCKEVNDHGNVTVWSGGKAVLELV